MTVPVSELEEEIAQVRDLDLHVEHDLSRAAESLFTGRFTTEGRELPVRASQGSAPAAPNLSSMAVLPGGTSCAPGSFNSAADARPVPASASSSDIPILLPALLFMRCSLRRWVGAHVRSCAAAMGLYKQAPLLYLVAPPNAQRYLLPLRQHHPSPHQRPHSASL